MDSRRYKKYLSEISARQGISAIEAEVIFKTAIAHAYDAIGSAYLWSDGTISLARDDRGPTIYIKNYVVSQKQYAKIVKIFEVLLQDYSQKRDTLYFASTVKDTVIDVEIIQKVNDGYIGKPILELGALVGYQFFLPTKKLFFNDNFKVGARTRVICKGFRDKVNVVLISRFDEKMASELFLELYTTNMCNLNRTYEYKSLHVFLNAKTKAVIFSVEWKNKPSSAVISFLSRELKLIFGRCNLVCKEIGHVKKDELFSAAQ